MIHRDRIYNINTTGLAKNTCIPVYLNTYARLKAIERVLRYSGCSEIEKILQELVPYRSIKQMEKIPLINPGRLTDFEIKQDRYSRCEYINRI